MILTTLYKRNSSNGKVQVWSIEIEGICYRSISGYQGGAMTTAAWTRAAGKNKGKSNEVTPEDQAVKEAEAKVVKKKEEGYTEDLEAVDQAKAEAWLEPMLAFPLEKKPKAIKQGEEYAVQPKLDGMRCITTIDGMFSRKGNPITSCPHIFKQAQGLLSQLPPGTRLDGELYHHEFRQDFNALISLVKKSTPLADVYHDLVQYHLYDIDLPDIHYAARYAMLARHEYSFSPNIKVVRTDFFTAEADVEKKIADYQIEMVEAGYEGAMVREIQRAYEHKRSDSLLKVKSFVDEEFIISDIVEGKGGRANMAGNLVVFLKDGSTCDAGIAGGVLYYKWLWTHRERLIGTKATVKFFGYTPDGKLRFPVVKTVDRQDL